MPLVRAPRVPARNERRPRRPIVAGAPNPGGRRPRQQVGARARQPRPRRVAERGVAGREARAARGSRKYAPWLLLLSLMLLAPSVVYVGRLIADPGPAIHTAMPAQHVVRPGEILTGIASRYGLTLDQLLARGGNRGRFPNPNRIHPGDKVELQ